MFFFNYYQVILLDTITLVMIINLINVFIVYYV